MSGQQKPLNVNVDMAPMLDAMNRLLSAGEQIPPELGACARREIESVIRAAQIDALAPHEFYAQFGANVFVLLARRLYSEKVATDLLKRIQLN